MIAETQRLNIRRLSVGDAEFVLAITNEPSVIENIGDKGLRSVADAKKFIREGPWTAQQKPGYGQFMIELKRGGHQIGVCGLLYRANLSLSDVGFALLPEYWRQGFAYEAANAVMNYGYTVLGLNKIAGLTSQSNTPSIMLLNKLGMRFEKMVSMSTSDLPTTRVYSSTREETETG